MLVLTQDVLRRELKYDPLIGRFTRLTKRGGRSIGTTAGNIDGNGYVTLNVCGVRIYAHRAAWLYVTGALPSGEIDHINRKRADNRFENLRDVDHSENCLNVPLRKHNTSGHRGIYWSKAHGLWTARIFRQGKSYSLKYFKTKEEAISARASAMAAMSS